MSIILCLANYWNSWYNYEAGYLEKNIKQYLRSHVTTKNIKRRIHCVVWNEWIVLTTNYEVFSLPYEPFEATRLSLLLHWIMISRFTAGRRRYLVQFNSMIQVSLWLVQQVQFSYLLILRVMCMKVADWSKCLSCNVRVLVQDLSGQRPWASP